MAQQSAPQQSMHLREVQPHILDVPSFLLSPHPSSLLPILFSAYSIPYVVEFDRTTGNHDAYKVDDSSAATGCNKVGATLIASGTEARGSGQYDVVAADA